MNVLRWSQRLALGFALVLAMGYTAQAQITLTPGDFNAATDFTSNNPANIDADGIEVLTGCGCQLTSLLKQNVGGGESGSLAGSYSVSFSNTSNDPEDALIEYDGGPSISVSNPTYLVVKDGNQDPSLYVFELFSRGWDGTESITLEDFWPQQGAISHIEIVGGNETTRVPEPTTLLLFGTGLAGLGFVSRRRLP